jgi:hypothetical protein
MQFQLTVANHAASADDEMAGKARRYRHRYEPNPTERAERRRDDAQPGPFRLPIMPQHKG